jgi:hypothetical protein
MQLQTGGMEFASEMVIKSTLKGLRIAEVPTTLHKDGRTRPPHLRSSRDGWRHLRFMLLFSPRWMFLVPGFVSFLLGLVVSLALIAGPLEIAGVGFGVHTLLVAGFLCLLGHQLLVFGLFTKKYAIVEGFHPPKRLLNMLPRWVTLELGVAAGLGLSMLGLGLLGTAAWSWHRAGLGSLDPSVTMRSVIPAVVLLALGIQTVFASFFLGIMSLRHK